MLCLLREQGLNRHLLPLKLSTEKILLDFSPQHKTSPIQMLSLTLAGFGLDPHVKHKQNMLRVLHHTATALFIHKKKWDYNKVTLRCPSPSFPPLHTFRGEVNEPVLTGVIQYPAPQQTCLQSHLLSTKLKQAKKYFSSSVCYLFSFCCYLRACSHTNVPRAQEPPDFASAALLCKPQRTALEQLFLCSWQSCGIFHSWVDQAEYQEHK